MSLIKKSKAKTIGFASLINRLNKKSNKLKGKKVISQIKINIPTYRKNNIPNSLKDIPISKPGSRYIK